MTSSEERLARIETMLEVHSTSTESRLEDIHEALQKHTETQAAQGERLARVETKTATHSKIGSWFGAGLVGLFLDRLRALL